MRRRTFSRLIASSLVALAGGARLLAAAPARVLRALRAREFPGRLRSFDPDAARRPGPWRG